MGKIGEVVAEIYSCGEIAAETGFFTGKTVLLLPVGPMEEHSRRSRRHLQSLRIQA